MSKDQFIDWGWRIPFLLSSFWSPSPLHPLENERITDFTHIKSTGQTSANPLVEAFTKWDNLKRVLISLLGATAGQGVIWYTGQFYALFYLQTILKVNPRTANIIVAVALLLACRSSPFLGHCRTALAASG